MYILKQIECSSAFSRRTKVMRDGEQQQRQTNHPTYQRFNIRENKENNNYKRQIRFFYFVSFLHGSCFVFSTHSFIFSNRIASYVFLLELWHRALLDEHSLCRCARAFYSMRSFFFLSSMLNILFHFCLFFQYSCLALHVQCIVLTFLRIKMYQMRLKNKGRNKISKIELKHIYDGFMSFPQTTRISAERRRGKKYAFYASV